MHTRSHSSRDATREGRPPQPPPQQEMLITREALEALVKETATRAAAEAVAQALAHRQHTDTGETTPGEDSSSRDPGGTLRNKDKTRREAESDGRTHRPHTHRESATLPTYAQGSRTLSGQDSHLAILPARRSPFTTAILAESLPAGMKIPNLSEFDGTGDPQEHLDRFYAKADLYDISDAAYCKIFRTTLAGRALAWFNKLPSGTIDSLENLTQRFLHQFSINKKYPKTAAYLFTVIQKDGEGLREYVQRFTQAVHEVPHVNHDLLAGIVQQNLRHRKFKESIAGKPPNSLEELLERAEKYIRIEEAIEPRYLGKRRREEERPERREEKRTAQSPRLQYTPLKARLSEILVVAEQQGLLQPPRPMKENPKRQRSDKYCRFHKDKGHSTEDCFSLRAEIEKLIKRGYLSDYVDRRRGQQRDNRRRDDSHPRGQRHEQGEMSEKAKHRDENLPTGGIISVITGGPACGDSNRARKSLARAARADHTSSRVAALQPVNEVSMTDVDVTFGGEDLESPRGEHNDALIISATISNFWVKKILVDSGSSADIIFHDAFQKLGLSNVQLAQVKTPLVGFTGEVVEAMGEVILPISLGSYPRRSTKMVKFLVVKAPSAYNVILGRPSLNLFRAVASTYHMKLKFPTSDGAGEAVGDSRLARECHASILQDAVETRRRQGPGIDSIKGKKQKLEQDSSDNGVHLVEGESEDRERMTAAEALKRIEIVPGDPKRTLKIGSDLSEEVESVLVAFLQRNTDAFAWGDGPLPGISPEYALHHLNVNPQMKPIKQKKRSFGPEKNKHIAEEVEKLIRANYIRPVSYPEWLANVVLVPKNGGKWRLCIDFTDLNKACPKDLFPLPRIDLLVDSTAGCELLSFLDAHQGYNQIRLAPEDQEKASFITDRGIYCYEVMPFGLKNAGATYQRLVNKMFANMIGRNMEVYIDDMLVKSVQAVKHVDDLEECFGVLRKYQMKLNPEKCSFGVRGGKFLGFMVSQRGIEANPEKIKAILSMSPPRSVKGVQELMGRMTALNRFISRAADKGLPFFRILRQGKGFKWSEECQQAFEELKKYLTTPPLLTKPQSWDTLLLYLATSSDAISAVLVVNVGREHRPVYYVSRTLQGAELRYTNIEKLALALVTATRKLRPYLLCHRVVVLTNHPLKQVLSGLEASGRMVKWAVELSEFGIEFQPRPAIKAQVLADFLVEMTTNEAECSIPTWVVYVDGSSTVHGSGAGVVLESPQGDIFQYSIKLLFSASNNEAEYEALVAGIKLALSVKGTYEAKEEKMTEYVTRVNELLALVESYDIKQVPRAKNEVADRLAKLASSWTNIDSRKITFLAISKEEAEEITCNILCLEGQEPSWKDEILAYLKHNDLPQDPAVARKLRVRAARFTIIDGELYKRGYSQPFLKCLTPSKADYVLREIHEGICGNHLGGKALAGKTLRQGYFWPTMKKDALQLVKHCRACQEHANLYHQPATLLQPLESPLPFAQWGMDLVGPFPLATGQRKFLIVAVDYFTKWVEAEALAKISEKEVISFLWKNIVCRFGIPRALISDNGTQFSGRKLKEWCEGLSIRQFFTSVGNPQANGQTEVTNRTILQHLKTRLGKAKGNWVEELPSALWAYRTTPCSSTGESPFNLVHGVEAVAPAEIGETSLRVKQYMPLENDQALRASLDMIDELRDEASVRAERYRARMARAYNDRVKPRAFQVGDLVMRKVDVLHPVGKLDPKWEGPYKVVEIIKIGTYRLQHQDGRVLSRPWNVANLRKFYP
ncbi:uncharacterized protein [Primulina eburnea]|uniref:uncharacterized protein n=1 Tax=Primulina eburnea TaxID=1245227 RepID=UPI003C6C48B4